MRRLSAIAFGLALAAGAFAQISIPKPPIPNLNLGSLRDLLFKEEAPLTSSLDDTIQGLTFLDGFEVGQYARLTNEMRNAKGTWTVQPGYFEVDIHSFCGRGYTYGPSRGMGYLEAPWKGPRAAILKNVMDRYGKQDKISQQDAQLLVWAILAKTKPSKMRGQAKAAAVALLSAEEIATLEVGALDFLEDRVMRDLMGPVDRAMRPFYEAENKMRQSFYQANQKFEELERLAVREAEEELESLIPRGRWIYHPNGYVMRFLPGGYSRTKIQIVVPHKPDVRRDDKGRIVRLECPPGWISEVEYNDELSPVADPDGSGRVAFPFKLVRLIAPDKDDLTKQLMHEVKDIGWCYVQKPKNTSLLFAGLRPAQGGWFSRWQDRAERIREYNERMEEAQRQAERMDRMFGSGGASSDDFMDMGHYRDGLDAALSGSTGDRLGWIGEHHMRQNEALISAINAISGLGDGSSEVDATGSVIIPANQGSQRLLGANVSH